MPTSQQDTEITLGTGRMLALFFTFVLVCAVFFAIGFSLGRKTSIVSADNLLSPPTGTPAAIVRPSAAKENTPLPAAQSTDFSFYKSVGAKTTDTDLTPRRCAATADASAEPPNPPTPVRASPAARADISFRWLPSAARRMPMPWSKH